MRMRIKQKMGLFLAVSTMATWLVMATAAQAGPPPLSTNPGNLAIFPAKGQSPEQQRLDESAAYDWATQQTGWDPYQAKALLDQQGHAAADAAGAARGGAVKGAAGGALVGVAVGAIAGDAGKGAAIGATSLGLTGGMRSRRAVKAAGNTSTTAVAGYQQAYAVWSRNFMAAMEAKGYTVR
ncbi:MAG: glycine zipper family protein [Planctomycetota bacterium]|nr:MAG: glycine zipper family protein [Planctomycetota bacterium]